MARQSSNRPSESRRGLRITLVVLFLLAVVGGAAYVYKVARSRTNPYQQALAAHEAGDDEAAEEQLRSMLEADPTDVRPRNLLIKILSENDRVAEAEELARVWLDVPETEALGLRTLSQLALQRMDLKEAVRLARMVADREPAFAQRVLMQVQDALGSPLNRERSAQAAETLAQLAEVHESKAVAFLYAAETLRELRAPLARLIASMAGESPQKEALTERLKALDDRWTLDATKARDALRESRLWKERIPQGKALMARIDLLIGDETRQASALAELGDFLAENPDDHLTRSSVVQHHVARGTEESYDLAVAGVRALASAPPMLLLRGISALAEIGRRTEALEALGTVDEAVGPMRDLVRARILMGGDEGEREQGMQAYEALVTERAEDWSLVREGYQQIRRVDRARALLLLERVGADDPKVRFAELLERAAAAVEAGTVEERDVLLASLVELAEGKQLVNVYERLAQIAGGGPTAAAAFIDLLLETGKAEGHEVRLLRAIRTSRHAAQTEGAPGLDEVKRDLETIVSDPDASRLTLSTATALAARIGEPRLAGQLIGRALVRAEESGSPLKLYLTACAARAESDRQAASEGMREAASSEPVFQAWLEELAAALHAGDATVLRRASADWNPTEGAPQPTEAALQLSLAALAKDWPEAEGYARKMLSLWPEMPGGQESLGASLLGGGKFEELLELHAGAELRPTQRTQRINAFLRLDRLEDAIAEARSLVRETDASDASLLVLGRLLSEVDPSLAYATIAPISGRGDVALFRAELLERRGDHDTAAQHYEALLRATGNRNIAAWQGLARVYFGLDRDVELVRRVTEVEKSRTLSPEELMPILLIRAQSLERIGNFERALDDYKRVLTVQPGNPIALNNAAWVINARVSWRPSVLQARREEALGLIDRAVAVAPESEQIRHTKAKILDALERREEALEQFEEAIGILDKRLANEPHSRADREAIEEAGSRRAEYLLDKAGLLKDLNRYEEAKNAYRAILDHSPDSPEGILAAEALEKMGG